MNDRWDARRRWRCESSSPVVIERPRPVIVRTPEPEPEPPPAPTAATLSSNDTGAFSYRPAAERPEDTVGAALWDALERGSRRAAVNALSDLLKDKDPDDELLPIWNEIASLGIPQGLRLGDLLDACAQTKG